MKRRLRTTAPQAPAERVTYSAADRSSTSRSRPTPSRSARCRSTKPRRQLGSHCPATDDSARMMVAVNASVAIASISEKPATSESGFARFIFLSLASADG